MSRDVSLPRKLINTFHLGVWSLIMIGWILASVLVAGLVLVYAIGVGVDPMATYMITDIWINSLGFKSGLRLLVSIGMVLAGLAGVSLLIWFLEDLFKELKFQIKSLFRRGG